MRGPIFVVLSLLVGTTAAAQIGISPPYLELDLTERGSVHSLKLLNFGKERVEVKAAPYNWDLDEESQVRILPPTEQSLDQWMIVQPVRFSIEPGKSQTVRIAVRPRVAPSTGEHRAIIYFEEVAPPDQPPTQFRVYFKLGAAVYGYAGDVTRVGKLHATEVSGGAATFDIASLGTAHVRLKGQVAVWQASRYPGAAKTLPLDPLPAEGAPLPEGIAVAGALPNRPVLPGTRRAVRLPLPADLAPGDYVLDVNGGLADEALDFGVPFTVAAPSPTPAAQSTPTPLPSP